MSYSKPAERALATAEPRAVAIPCPKHTIGTREAYSFPRIDEGSTGTIAVALGHGVDLFREWDVIAWSIDDRAARSVALASDALFECYEYAITLPALRMVPGELTPADAERAVVCLRRHNRQALDDNGRAAIAELTQAETTLRAFAGDVDRTIRRIGIMRDALVRAIAPEAIDAHEGV